MTAEDRPLRTRRVEVGWSQRELAEAAGVDHTTVSRMERTGEGSLESWQRVETALAWRVEDLRKVLGRPPREPQSGM